MSSTNTWPERPIDPAWTISETASGIVMKKRVISGWVTLTGPPRSIWRRKIGITLPDEPSTLPKRTATKRVGTSVRAPYASTIHSQTRLRLAHHRLRVHRLVGRDEHEALDPELDGDLGDHLRRERVVAHRLERVRLHQRHVLVRGRVEDDRRRVALEDAAHARACCRRRRAPGRSARSRARRRARARSRTARSRPGRRGSGACSRCARSGGRARSRSSRRRR